MKESTGSELRLREKIISFGASQLTDEELFAVFIGSGNRYKTCLELAQDTLRLFKDFRSLFQCDFASFNQIHGLGAVRYTQLQAALEMCRRSDRTSLSKNTQLSSPYQSAQFLKRLLRDQKNEIFSGIFLDSQNRVLSYEELFKGTLDMAMIHPRPIIDRIMKLNAAALILAHNHPSGDPKPSQEDIHVTSKLEDALALIDTRLLDHLIIGDNVVYSILHGTQWVCH